MTTAIEQMKDEAKSLGIKGAHLMKQETLEAKIAEAKEPAASEPTEVRKVAPRMNVQNITSNDRRRIIAELERDNPGYKYMFQPKNISGDALENKGLESTGKTWRNNIICRTSMDGYHDWQAAKRQHQRRVMDSVDVEGRYIKSVTEAPKKGV